MSRTIQRQQVFDAGRALGLDLAHLKSVHMNGKSVRVTVYAVDADGQRIVVGDGDYVGFACVITDFDVVGDAQ